MTTMKIVCLGWGSLMWDPKELKTKGKWHKDGPQIRVEFCRQSSDGRITLALDRRGTWVNSLWIEMDFDNVDEAIKNLALREGNSSTPIGSWEKSTKNNNDNILNLEAWASHYNIDAVIWTDLTCRFKKKNGIFPTLTDLEEYFANLEKAQYECAKKYIEKAPEQIQTNYRSRLEEMFSITKISS